MNVIVADNGAIANSMSWGNTFQKINQNCIMKKRQVAHEKSFGFLIKNLADA